MRTEVQDIAVEALKATPAIAASAFTLNTLVALLTAIFIVLQIVYLIAKWKRENTEWGQKLKRRASRKRKAEDDDDTDLGGLG